MKKSFYARLFSCLLLGAYLLSSGVGSVVAAGQYLVGDRTLGRVLRYSENGTFLGTLINDPSLGSGLGSFDGGITGLTLSPDQSKLYVSDRLSNRVAVYSYNGTSAAHLFNITGGINTINAPATVLFSQDASKIYVANLGPFGPLPTGDKVAQLTPNGATAGPDLTGGPAQGRSGLAWNPNGDLLVGNLNLFGGDGRVLRYDSGSSQFVNFIGPLAELGGASNLLVHGNDLYVAALDGSRVGRFNATTGALDTSFGTNGYLGPSLSFAGPASLAIGPGGNSILVGLLGFQTGASSIEEFDFGGNSLGVWANNTHNTNFPGMTNVPSSNILGFSEPTGIVFSTFVPEPSSLALGLLGMVTLEVMRRRAKSLVS